MMLLTLIMIVKNEAKLLPSFFHHHQGLFDEMIVVDTGSDDESPALIRSAGATLIHHQWQDDFAAARNATLAAAHGKWLLVLDADERVAAEDFDRLRKFLQKAPSAIYQQKTINYFPGTNHLEWQPVSGLYPKEEKGQTGFFAAQRAGLFPKGMGLKFSGRVHESILPSSAETGLETRLLEIPIHHYGYVISSKKNKSRKKVYNKLVARKLAENPQDWSALLEMASIHLENDEPEKSKKLLSTLVNGPDHLPAVNRGRFLLGRIFIEEKSPDPARELLNRATQADPNNLFAWLALIRLESRLGSWSAVAELLHRSKGFMAEFEPLLMRENLMFLIHTGQIHEATLVANKLVEICPQWQEISTLAGKLASMKDFGQAH
jgi:glycosyltransferase involved in cell wall biosynthesis